MSTTTLNTPNIDTNTTATSAPVKRRASSSRSKKVVPTPTVDTSVTDTNVPPPIVETPVPPPIVETLVPPPIVEKLVPHPIIKTEDVQLGFEGPSVVSTEDDKKRVKRTATKEKLLTDFEALSVKLLPLLGDNKTLLKEYNKVKSDTYRLLKLKTSERKTKDVNNSGFMKPVRISQELEQFLLLDNAMSDTLTRAYLTAKLCDYIKKNNLQNPGDKRIIFPDSNLKKLFRITDNETEPLTYYNIQKKIQSHIFKIEPIEKPVSTLSV